MRTSAPMPNQAQKPGFAYAARPQTATSGQFDREHSNVYSQPTRGLLQTKLAINTPGNAYEQEADRVAEQVMRLPASQPACSCGGGCAQCQAGPTGKASGQLQPQRIGFSGLELAPVPNSVNEALNSSGQPLDPDTRSFMESRFGHDFGSVRIHHDEPAAKSAQAIHALAYTVGRDVVFGPGQYQPQTTSGRRLLGHELTHVVQQGAAGNGMAAPGPQARISQAASAGGTVFRDPPEGEGNADDQVASQLIFANIGPKSMDGILKDLDQRNLEELTKLRANAALAEPYGRERLELAMKVVWYAKFQRAVLAENRPFLQAEIDRVVPDASHHDQHEALTLYLNQSRAQSTDGAAPTAATPKNRGKSKGATAAPSEETMASWDANKQKKWQGWLDSRDAKVQSFGAADYADYVANMLVSGGAVFGKSIPATNPVHPLFLDRLEAASIKARAAIGSDDFGIRNITGQDNRPGNHAWGLAVDIDADANPYILNEAGEAGVDAAVAPVYQRIAKALLDRDSIITPPTPGTGKKDPGKKSGLEGADYTALAEESDAMAAYFSVLPAPDPAPAKAPAKGKKAAVPPPPLPAARKMSSVVIDPKKIAALDQTQVKADYDLLMGKTKIKNKGSGDLPFAGSGSGQWRDPKRGFLSIRKEVAEALKGEGLRWGATDFPGASGDVMHFDDNNRHGDYVAYGKSHPTDQGKAKKGA